MASPFAADDAAIEQVIYTWSRVNRGGGKGLGFGAVTPRLKNHARWLNSWPTKRLQLAADGLTRAHLFEGWRGATTMGAFQSEDVNVVYRKIADAGVDGVGRDRHIVHALIGRREILDLAAVAPNAGVWLTAEQCPLDELPRLEPLSASDLKPWSFDHDDDLDDAWAVELIARSPREGDEIVISGQPARDADRAILAMHLVVPTELWPDLEVTPYLDWDGVTTRVAVRPRGVAGASESRRRRLERARMGSCALHSAADRSWRAGRPATWSGLLSAGAPGGSPVAVSISERDGQQRTARELIRALGAEASGSEGWDFDSQLDDRGVARMLARPGVERTLGLWICDAQADELTSVFGGARERRTFARVSAVMAASGLSAGALAAAWRKSAAAPLGFALLDGDTSALAKGWAVPAASAADHEDAAARLAEQLVTSDQWLSNCAALFSGGVMWDREWRRVMIDALLAAGASPGFVFGQLAADVADRGVVVEIMIDHLDAFCEWLRMPHAYREALRSALARPSLLSRLFGMMHA